MTLDDDPDEIIAMKRQIQASEEVLRQIWLQTG